MLNVVCLKSLERDCAIRNLFTYKATQVSSLSIQTAIKDEAMIIYLVSEVRIAKKPHELIIKARRRFWAITNEKYIS